MNEDGFAPLDIAIMTNNMPLAKIMLKYGAKENTKCKFICKYYFYYQF
jgi:ankyrin repeat protein